MTHLEKRPGFKSGGKNSVKQCKHTSWLVNLALVAMLGSLPILTLLVLLCFSLRVDADFPLELDDTETCVYYTGPFPCTANDVADISIETTSATQGRTFACAGGYARSSTSLKFKVDARTNRYDVGWIINPSGGSAIFPANSNTPQEACYRALITPSESDPPSPFNLDGDGCGDVKRDNVISQTKDVVIDFECPTSSGPLKLYYCAVWDNNNDKDDCEDHSDLKPGTGAKCRCRDVVVGQAVVVTKPTLRWTDIPCYAGEPIKLKFEVTNGNSLDGKITLTSVPVYTIRCCPTGSTDCVTFPGSEKVLAKQSTWQCSFEFSGPAPRDITITATSSFKGTDGVAANPGPVSLKTTIDSISAEIISFTASYEHPTLTSTVKVKNTGASTVDVSIPGFECNPSTLDHYNVATCTDSKYIGDPSVLDPTVPTSYCSKTEEVVVTVSLHGNPGCYRTYDASDDVDLDGRLCRAKYGPCDFPDRCESGQCTDKGKHSDEEEPLCHEHPDIPCTHDHCGWDSEAKRWKCIRTPDHDECDCRSCTTAECLGESGKESYRWSDGCTHKFNGILLGKQFEGADECDAPSPY